MPLVLRKRVDLPHDPGEWVEVKKPSYKAIMEYQGSEFDSLVLIKSCIERWSYPEECTPENIEQLIPETVRLLVNELIWKLDEEEEKKDSRRSTKRSTATE